MKNVVLVTIDCLRADHVSCMGYERNTTPNIDQIAEEGVLFEQAIAQGGRTATSFPSILTSTYPLMFGNYKGITRPRKTIAEVLRENGYSTAGFHANPSLSRYFNYDRGFETFRDFVTDSKGGGGAEKGFPPNFELKGDFRKKILNLVQRLHCESRTLQKLRRTPLGKKFMRMLNAEDTPSAETINAEAIEWVEKNKSENFFLWIHYMEPHMPLVPPMEDLSIFSPHSERLDSTGLKDKANEEGIMEEELKELIDLYDAEVHHADRALGNLLMKLGELGLWEDTILVITADHGEEQMDHGNLGHLESSLYEELIHVPLVIRSPDEDGKKLKRQVPLIDLSPTLLDSLGLEKPRNFVGDSLLPKVREGLERNSKIISELARPEKDWENRKRKPGKVSCRTDDWKLIYNFQDGKHELYNLVRDTKEYVNLVEEEKDIFEELENKIKNHISWERETSSNLRSYSEKLRIKEKLHDFSL